MLTEIDENQRMDATERAQGLLDMLHAWQVVRSGPLQAPVNIGENERHSQPWGASIRVARSTGSALWCDDIALRRWGHIRRNPNIRHLGTLRSVVLVTTRRLAANSKGNENAATANTDR